VKTHSHPKALQSPQSAKQHILHKNYPTKHTSVWASKPIDLRTEAGSLPACVGCLRPCNSCSLSPLLRPPVGDKSARWLQQNLVPVPERIREKTTTLGLAVEAKHPPVPSYEGGWRRQLRARRISFPYAPTPAHRGGRNSLCVTCRDRLHKLGTDFGTDGTLHVKSCV